MLSLSDRQLAAVMKAARGLPVEKRGLFQGWPPGCSCTDSDLGDAVHPAQRGLVRVSA
jgi:hypothetical protein